MKSKTNMKFNKKYNRYESDIDHHYTPFIYREFKYSSSQVYKGKIKCRLVHTSGNSIIFPDFILLNNGWIQPLQFLAPLLAKDDDLIVADFYIDISSGETIRVRIFKASFIESYPDKSQLFECEIYGPDDIEDYINGEFNIIDGKYYLKLFHHTNEIGFNGITSSKSIRSSKWNYRGSKECLNYHFVYFTHIPEIKFANDLITVAMSSDGNLDYMIDSFTQPKLLPPNYREIYKDYIYTAQVYRSTTADRQKAISFYVPIDYIDCKHTYLHNQVGVTPFYEICFPYIHRIKVSANSSIQFNESNIILLNNSIVNSDHSIIGDARVKDGLAAPFEEEDTHYIFKIEFCGNETLLEFWFNHGNQDLFSGKKVEKLKLKDVDDNPTK